MQPGRLIASCEEAVRHAAPLLGSVTHAANPHKMTVVDDEGNVSHKVCRDAMEAPRQPKRKLTPNAHAAKPSESAAY